MIRKTARAFRALWKRLKLAGRALVHPERLLADQKAIEAVVVGNRHHRITHSRRIGSLYDGTDDKEAARLFRFVKYSRDKGLMIWYTDGRERDRYDGG